MPLSRDSRQERKVKAYLRAKISLQQRFERIDYEEDVVGPTIEAMKAGKSVLGLPDGAAFDLVLLDENRDSTPTDNRE